MPIKHYPEIAAARHMRNQPLEPTPRERRPGEPRKAPPPRKRKGSAPRPVNSRLAPVLQRDPAYGRKRLIALALTALVCLSVPGLIVLLVLFG
ncbi:hypothetical protein [Arthrobacter sp. zg-Y179]|uniref:hypothetical protein n=1 Tax=Arthrobacter sp. zg-Y179 TaxID=2894188 RepID=UPI001E533DC1|nr:hypothetical protein [Arthrobacter sp. zg-Y179]MCC9174285.1 hypothetical protein [Arthrobacter sp. zg-Y179]